ncbi:MAG: YqjF family protein [Ktedonobacterales bacterium]
MRASAILRNTSHRPWPLPRQPWLMRQTWDELLFAHWPVPAMALAERLPPGLTLDTWEGRAWLGIVPFRMRGVRLRAAPTIPGCAAFPELNLRTYVTAQDKPGVWFLSLDAGSPLAVAAARATYSLPYYTAHMRCCARDGAITYDSRRYAHRGAAPASFSARYWPVGDLFTARPGTLDHFLTERYCLYTAGRRDQLLRADITHAPWRLQAAAAEIAANTIAAAAGITLSETAPPLLHYAAHQEALAWAPRRVRPERAHNVTKRPSVARKGIQDRGLSL